MCVCFSLDLEFVVLVKQEKGHNLVLVSFSRCCFLILNISVDIKLDATIPMLKVLEFGEILFLHFVSIIITI